MEQYIVSARKYRPSDFRSVIGQNSLTTTLKNAIINRKLAHAYLFCGPRGVGKTTCARIFAKTINCTNLTESGEACNACESCVSFNEQRSLNIFEMDAASNNSVDDIRELVKQVMVPPQIGKYRVYIIDEVHMLSTPAFNAFLKTLEEPPEYAIFILATTEKHKILPTIISRCQVYDFNRIQLADTVDYLQFVAEQEHIVAEREALEVIAQKADGAMRDALSIFDQIVSYCGKEIKYKAVIDILNVLDYEYYLRLVDCFLQGDVVESLLILDDIINKGFDLQSFVSGLSSHIRDLLVSQNEKSVGLLQVSASVKERYLQQAKQCSPIFLFRALDLCIQCELNYKVSKNKRLLVELTMIKICQLTSEAEKKNDSRQKIGKIDTDDTSPAPKTNKDTLREVAASSQSQTKKPPHNILSGSKAGLLNLSSIMSGQADKAPDAANPKQPDTPQANGVDFTEDDLLKQWLEYAETVKELPFFYKYVTEISPKKDGNSCVITVVNEHQIQEFSDNRQQIESFLSQRLGRDVKLVVNKREIEISKSLSPKEALDKMKSKNKHLQDFTDRIGLDFDYLQ